MASKKRFVHDYTNNYNLDIRPGETDLQYYRRIAKVADQRLVRLEALKHQPHFKNVENFAYARAMRDIESYGGTKRWNTKPPESERLLKEKITDIIRFLESPTSTKKGTIEVYQKRVDTINKNLDLEGKEKITWQDFATITESGDLDTLIASYGSETAFASIGKVKRSKNKVDDIVNKAKSKKYGSPLDQAVNDIIKNNMLGE